MGAYTPCEAYRKFRQQSCDGGALGGGGSQHSFDRLTI